MKIAHDLGLIQAFAHQIAVMYLGTIVEVLPGEDVDKAQHPYTQALLGAVFDTKMDFTKKIESIDSEIPSPLDMPPGCPFQTRCDRCMEICRKERPKRKIIGEGHEVACCPGRRHPAKNGTVAAVERGEAGIYAPAGGQQAGVRPA